MPRKATNSPGTLLRLVQRLRRSEKLRVGKSQVTGQLPDPSRAGSAFPYLPCRRPGVAAGQDDPPPVAVDLERAVGWPGPSGLRGQGGRGRLRWRTQDGKGLLSYHSRFQGE